jgi:hypothetical protein
MAHPRFFVGLYTVVIREKGSSVALPLASFDTSHNLQEEFQEFCRLLRATHLIGKSEVVTWQVRQYENDGETIAGIVEVGDYGYTTRLMDVQSGAAAYNRRPNDAEMVPMFFALDAPDHARTGIIILQKHGIRSPLSFFTEAFRNFFQQRFPEHLLDMVPFVAQTTLNAFRDGQLQQITLVKYELAPDLAAQVRLRVPRGVSVSMETTIKVRNKGRLAMPAWVRNYFTKREEGAHLPPLPGEADAVRVQVTHRGQLRTIQLGRPEDMVPYLDATDEVETRNGHPVYASIKRYAFSLLADAQTEIRGR